jgi:site-specific DNA recombinase
MSMSKRIEKTEEDVFKDIQSGKYREYYLIYNRKSTDEADNQKNSISYQKSENARYAHRERLPIAPITIKGFCADGVISEKHSGFTEDDDITISDGGLVQYRIDRPKFQRMLQFVNQGYFKGIICLCWDRISRNKGDDTIIRKLMRRGVDIRFVYAKYEKTSSGALHMDIDGMFAQHHSRVTSEKVSMTIRNAREKGICTYRAPIGYLNLGKMEHKPIDPERGPIIQRMYELYATGDWSLSDLARWACEQGFTTVPMRRRRSKEEMLDEEDDEVAEIPKISRPVTVNLISRILTNPFYTGKTLDADGGYTESISHEPLVTQELFDDVQAVLKKKKVSIHYTEKLDLPLRGIIRCAHCSRVYTPYPKKGIQYYNARCVSGCENTFKNFNFAFIDKEVKGLLSNLYFTEDEIAEMDARAGTEIALLEEKRQKGFDQMERKKKKIREDLGYLRTNKIPLLKSGVYTPEEYVAEEEKLEAELSVLKDSEDVSDVAMRETMKDIEKLSELIKDVVPVYDFAKPHEKEKIIRVIFSELYVAQDVLQYKVKKGFEAFENRFVAVCDPTESRTPLSWMRTKCPSR